VCLDTAGADGGIPYVEAAAAEHPSLLDQAHVVDEMFGIVNVPNGVWIDENGTIVRPAEPAFPGAVDRPPRLPTAELEGRMAEMMGLAGQIVVDRETYPAALADWATRGAHSPFVLAPDKVLARSGERTAETACAAAHFELAQHLERQGHHDAAVEHFRASHRLAPDNWTYRRQAWSIEPSPLPGPLARFWQGPMEAAESDWPYDGDWVSDIRRSGPETYYGASAGRNA
jgi:Tetratricopeptide repeat